MEALKNINTLPVSAHIRLADKLQTAEIGTS